MSVRQDKLVVLLDTGTSNQVRRTAARQLADLAAKTFRAAPKHITPQHVDTKPDLAALDAEPAATAIHADDAWAEALETIAKVAPLLASKSTDTRQAAANALGLLAATLPAWNDRGGATPAPCPLQTEPLDVHEVLRRPTLLASEGREYIAKPRPGDKNNRRQAMLGSVGLGDAVGWGDDVDKIIEAEDDDGDIRPAISPAARSTPPAPPSDTLQGLSARQIAALKRKKGDVAEEANKMRRLNDSPSTAPSRASSPEKPGVTDTPPAADGGRVVIDPGRKVEPVAAPPLFTLAPGRSPWSVVAIHLVAQLGDAKWQTRHGASLGLMELVLPLGSAIGAGYSGDFLLGIAQSLLKLLALDRFGDFVGDTVVAPVRETAAQALGATLKFLDATAVIQVQHALMDMARQPWVTPNGERFAWQVRHAGLLAVKYFVAVRPDMLDAVVAPGETLLANVIDAAVTALQDADDDVRTVAAAALLPASDRLESAPLLDTLWACLAAGYDDLGSSTGAVMDLLGTLLGYPFAVAYMAEADRPRRLLVAHMFAFFRHSIGSVRLAVAQAIRKIAATVEIPTDWVDDDVASFLFQNLVLEQRPDIVAVSLAAFTAVVAIQPPSPSTVAKWYSIVMTMPGVALDPQLFVHTSSREYTIDKPIMRGDLSLAPVDVVVQSRVTAALGLAKLPSGLHNVTAYLSSGSAHQTFLAAVIIQDSSVPPDGLLAYLASPPPPTYSEMTLLLSRVQLDCASLLQAFHVEAKVSKNKIPDLPPRVDPLGQGADVFTMDSARQVVGPTFDALAKLVKAKPSVAGLAERRRKIYASIGFYDIAKERYDRQVFAAVSGALLARQTLPAKLGGIIKAVMDAVKKEENELLQQRAASSVAALIAYCASPAMAGRPDPTDKVLKNLFTFANSVTSITPVFSSASDGILSLKQEASQKAAGDEGLSPAQVTRRGALSALAAVARHFGPQLFDRVPAFRVNLTSALQTLRPDPDTPFGDDAPFGQALIDNLVAVRLLCDDLDTSLHPHLVASIFTPLLACLCCAPSLVRSMASRALAALCNAAEGQVMRLVVDHVLPLLGDPKNLHGRQGAIEAIHHIVKLLEIKALPYVLFLIVPVLGRMSDPDDQVRLLSTTTFAALIKLVPLEAGLPDPVGFSPELLARRDQERQFLAQLLDGSKAEQYPIPIPIKAELRQYQKEGVSWLAFLAKYQLHGILCDDMGLGKSLQTICIVGSKHHERAARFSATRAVDAAHLPSLIVCPPTLVGHWFYEIEKFTDGLRPVQYVGNAAARASLAPKLAAHDIVITSYDIVRNDIATLSKVNWLYCVLDEGHIIKNAKTKLSQAVKQIQAQHRLLLSGTPIQNNVLELWSLFDFLMPGFLGSERAFNDRFSKPILADREGKATARERDLAAASLEALHKQVLPFLLRRLKEDVLNDLPPKIIQDYYCELSEVQRVLYDEFAQSRAAEEAGESVAAAESGGGQHIFQSLQYLRKLCNHPALVLHGKNIATIGSGKLRQALPMTDISHAPKLEALKQLLQDCGIGVPPTEKLESSDGHRVLVFCQSRAMLDRIEADLFAQHMPSVKYMRMDGATDPSRRHAVVQTYNADTTIDVLLLTTSVGGLGLNLTGADTVIFVDHDWNPMKDLQAMDRAHRLGQKKVVNVYRLITRGTLEEKIMGLQRFKLNIASSVVTQQNAGLGSMNTGEVLDLFQASEPTSRSKAATAPVSASKILEGLDDLPPDTEYDDLSLDYFLSKM